jgi:uncharacterized DUF497 family protein
MIMEIELDPVKDASNIAKHGIGLAKAECFEMDITLVRFDDRHEEDR